MGLGAVELGFRLNLGLSLIDLAWSRSPQPNVWTKLESDSCKLKQIQIWAQTIGMDLNKGREIAPFFLFFFSFLLLIEVDKITYSFPCARLTLISK